MIEEVLSIDELKQALRGGQPIVIHDEVRTIFHRNPWACGHVEYDSFHTKVVKNKGKSGGYFTVGSFAEAVERWPSLKQCE